MTNFTDHQIGQLATEAAEHGDMIGAAIYRKAIGSDYSDVALSPIERQSVDHLTVQECRAAALEAVENGIDMAEAELARDLED